MDEHDRTMLWQHQLRCSQQITAMEPETVSEAMDENSAGVAPDGLDDGGGPRAPLRGCTSMGSPTSWAGRVSGRSQATR